ncbi:hypothetical protein SORBI_3003G229150 [Sorghum bicolor]|uniref:Uncharacterized protein n=1 Tax=Sorghum bicolor TaxID=4558 RepID=A0A1W0VYJ7_SORBI|nr:hypothetical protein SORBI_3003G229150 [Sorghum bicolor]
MYPLEVRSAGKGMSEAISLALTFVQTQSFLNALLGSGDEGRKEIDARLCSAVVDEQGDGGGVDLIGGELGGVVDLVKHDTKHFVELDLGAENQYIRQSTKLPLIIFFIKTCRNRFLPSTVKNLNK